MWGKLENTSERTVRILEDNRVIGDCLAGRQTYGNEYGWTVGLDQPGGLGSGPESSAFDSSKGAGSDRSSFRRGRLFLRSVLGGPGTSLR